METLDSVDNSVENLQHLLPNPNVLVAVSKAMWAVNLCTNKKVLNWRCQLTQVDLYNGCKTVAVVVGQADNVSSEIRDSFSAGRLLA